MKLEHFYYNRMVSLGIELITQTKNELTAELHPRALKPSLQLHTATLDGTQVLEHVPVPHTPLQDGGKQITD